MSRRIYQLAYCCVLLVIPSPLFAQSGKQHKPELSLDPIFGLHYDRYAVKYEILPTEISRSMLNF